MSGIESWSTTPANNNQAPPFGWPAGILPSQVEPIGRQMMTSLAAWYQAAEWINYNFTPTYIGATQFSLPGNATATYHVGRRVQATDGSTSVFGTITASVFTSLTTVTVVWDTGVLQTGVTIVYVGITSFANTSAPTPNPALPIMTGLWTFSGQPVIINNNGKNGLLINSSGTNYGTFQNDAADTWSLGTAPVAGTLGTSLLKWTKNGNFTFATPGSGKTLQVGVVDGGTVFDINSSTAVSGYYGTFSHNGVISGYIGLGLSLFTGAALADFGIAAAAGVLRLSTNAGATTHAQITSTGVLQAVDAGGTMQDVGWRDIPQNLQTANYSPALSDRGKGVDFNGTTLTCTIPANGSVAFPVGTTIVITNLNASSLSIAITTDILTLAGTTTTGTRALSQNGMATIRKVTSTSWLISGSGLS